MTGRVFPMAENRVSTSDSASEANEDDRMKILDGIFAADGELLKTVW